MATMTRAQHARSMEGAASFAEEEADEGVTARAQLERAAGAMLHQIVQRQAIQSGGSTPNKKCAASPKGGIEPPGDDEEEIAEKNKVRVRQPRCHKCVKCVTKSGARPLPRLPALSVLDGPVV